MACIMSGLPSSPCPSKHSRGGVDRTFVSPLADLPPTLFAELDAELLRRRHDPLPRCVALGVADAFDLVEPCDGVADMARILEWLLALLGKSESAPVEPVALLLAELGHGRSSIDARRHNARGSARFVSAS